MSPAINNKILVIGNQTIKVKKYVIKCHKMSCKVMPTNFVIIFYQLSNLIFFLFIQLQTLHD